MAQINGEIVIARPVDVVFDYAADQRNEPDYNPRMVRSEKIADGPVGQGTVFQSARGSGTLKSWHWPDNGGHGAARPAHPDTCQPR